MIESIPNVPGPEADRMRSFTRSLINDVRALEYMLNNNMIESDGLRIGAEQELVIVDYALRPATLSMEILKHLEDPHFTTELARFNIEFNLDPLTFEGKCLSQLEANLTKYIKRVKKIVREYDADVLLVGALPTLRQSDLVLDNMTPRPRYYALEEALKQARGDDYEFFLEGVDELHTKQDSLMLEACNTSYQVHFQVNPHNFAWIYNAAQAVTAPVLAVAANSPLLFGKRLWSETRIAVFQQSVDNRHPDRYHRERIPRVSFGNSWVRSTILEIYHESVSRFRALIDEEIDEDPFEVLNRGGVPRLKALSLHNGTTYRWNRPCYGITDGKPHLRIENRVLPAGPTVIDEVANAAFWFGLIRGVIHEYGNIATVMEFDAAKSNFIGAARHGLKTQFAWVNGETLSADELIRQRLLPMAREGLQEAELDPADIKRYLGVIEGRATSRQNGSKWILNSFAQLRTKGTLNESLANLTAAMRKHQSVGKPVHEWPIVHTPTAVGWEHHYQKIGQFMTTDLFTVNEHDIIDLATCLMEWRHIRHVPVEDEQGFLVGLISLRSLLALRRVKAGILDPSSLLVSSIMETNVQTVTPETYTLDAIEKMIKDSISCLPVVEDGQLVGIVTEYDFLKLTAQLLEEKLRQ